MRACRLLDKV